MEASWYVHILAAILVFKISIVCLLVAAIFWRRCRSDFYISGEIVNRCNYIHRMSVGGRYSLAPLPLRLSLVLDKLCGLT